MAEEVYSTGSPRRIHLSPSQIRHEQKKALQSYRHINSIKTKATTEASKAADEAEQKLNEFITSGSTSHGK